MCSERKFSVFVFNLRELLTSAGGHLVGGVGTGALVLAVGELHGIGDHFRTWIEPVRATRFPLRKYLFTNSAVPRHATQSTKSTVSRWKRRSTARAKDTTGVPFSVRLNSGSRAIRPIS